MFAYMDLTNMRGISDVLRLPPIPQSNRAAYSQTSINPRTGRTVHPILIYTPPYCPRSNAIEAGFKTMNDYIKQHEDGISQTDPAAAITNGLKRVTGELALKLVKQSHYDVMSWLYTG